jgi:hypothetical protein
MNEGYPARKVAETVTFDSPLGRIAMQKKREISLSASVGLLMLVRHRDDIESRESLKSEAR